VMLEHRSRVALLVLFSLIATASAVAKEPAAAPDAELLEFLGDLDSDDEADEQDDGDWLDFLARTDLERLVGRKAGDKE